MAIKRNIHDRKGEGNILGNIGVVYFSLAQYDKALTYVDQALVIRREIHDRAGEGMDLGNIGAVYRSLGQYTKALDYHEQALMIQREISNHQGEGNNLGNIGLAYYQLGQPAKALAYYEQALAIQRKIGDRQGEASTLTNIGLTHEYLGQDSKALESYEQSLVIERELGDRAGESRDLNNLGVVYEKQGDYPKARATYQQALQIVTTTGEPETLWLIWNNLSEVSTFLDNPLAAIFYGKQAVNTLQTMRGHVAKLEDKSLHASFLQNKTHVYQHLADLLLRQGRLFEAQKVLELLKQEEYFDFIRRTRAFEIPDDGVRYTPPEQPWAARFQKISAQLVTLGEAYSLLRARKRGARL